MSEHINPVRQKRWAGGFRGSGRPAASSPVYKRSGLRRAVMGLTAFCFSMVVLAAVGLGAVLALLANGSISVDVSRQMAAALDQHVGGGYDFAVGSTAIARTASGPALTVNGLSVRDGQGRTIVAAPRASIAVDLMRLAVGQISPKRLELQDLVIHLVRLPDGTMALSAGADQGQDVRLTNLASTLSEPHDTSNPGPPASGPNAAADAGTIAAPAAAPQIPALLAKAIVAATNTLFDEGSLLHAVDRFGLQNASLVVDDRLRGKAMTYRNLDLEFDRRTAANIGVTVSADGPAGHWSGNAQAERLPDGSRRVEVSADKLSPDELMIAAGVRAAAFETDMPLSFDLSVEVGPDGRLVRAGGPLSFGAGYFKLDDPDHEPAMVDRFDSSLTMDARTGTLTFGKGVLAADATRFGFEVTIAPPATAGDPWTGSGKASGVFGAERPGEQPIPMDRVGFKARFFPATRQFFMDQAGVNGPTVAFKMNASFEPTATGFLVKSTMDMGQMPGATVIRLWPNWVAAPVRAWFLRNLQGGSFDYGHGQLSLTDVDLDRMRHQHSVPEDHAHIEFGVRDGAVSFMDGVPPLRGLDGTGVITGNSFTFRASKAEMEVSPGHRLTASDGTMTVPDTDPKPTPTAINLRINGAIDTLADLLSREALKPYANLPIDSSAVAGTFDGRLSLNFRIGDHVPKDEVKIGVVATTHDFSATKVIGKEPLQNAALNITADPTGIHAKGDGRMFGAPATIDLKKPAGGAPSEATLTVTLDDAARQKAGFSFGRSITGPITAKIVTSFSPSDKSKASVALDFTRCAFDDPLPGLKKAAERPSRATFTVVQDANRSQLDNIVFDSGSVSVRGSAVLDANGGLSTASLSQLRLSPGDDARVEVSRAGEGYRLNVRGENIDARPFLRFATGDAANTERGGEAGTQPPIDLDLHAGLITGQNAQALTGVDLHLSKRGTQLRKLSLTGTLGHGAVKATTTGGGENPVVVVTAKDAGALLSFLDLYKRMDGGQLDTTLRLAGNRIDGSAVVRNFTIREDPSIKKLAEEGVPSGSRNAGARIDASEVRFRKLEAQFTKTGSKVEVRQGSMFGPQVGATVQGQIDFGADKVALDGTFVPLYGINNLFSQIPVLGPILGGDSHEGLFALNYRIVGSASAPVLSINPLSALTPGFLRKIFGAIDNAAQQGAGDAAGGQSNDVQAVPE